MSPAAGTMVGFLIHEIFEADYCDKKIEVGSIAQIHGEYNE
jgi:hypothetical protein